MAEGGAEKANAHPKSVASKSSKSHSSENFRFKMPNLAEENLGAKLNF